MPKQRELKSIQSNEFYQELIIANPQDLKKQMKVRFLVDTGASGTVIPLRIAEELDLQCVGEGLVELADGRQIKTGLAYLYLRINSDHVFTLASYDGCKTPLLGFDVMHVLGLQLDISKKQLLKPVRRFSLVNFILGKGWIETKRRKGCVTGSEKR